MMSTYAGHSCFFDKNGSGYIELDELREALANESGETDEHVLKEIMQEVDTDKVHNVVIYVL